MTGKRFQCQSQNNWGMCNNVEEINWISQQELKDIYSRSLCVVVPSIWPEPHPLIPLEAMSCGTPVIGSRIAGIEESVIDEKTGYLIDIKEEDRMAQEIADKIIILYKDKNKRKELGIQAREHVKNKFNLDRMVNDYIKIYQQIINK